MILSELAGQIGGVLEGDPDLEVTGLAALADAGPGDLSFLTQDRYAALLAETKAGAVIVPDGWAGESPCALIRVSDPDAGFAQAAALLSPPPPTLPEGIHETAVISESAQVSDGARIGPYVVVEAGAVIGEGTEIWAGSFVGQDVNIGDSCTLHPNVSIREGCQIGNRVIVHCGAVIGCDGFGYVQEDGKWIKIRQVGIVQVEDDVEIGANVTIDRARFGKTVIGEGSKIDNLCQIAHNVRVGAHCAFAAQVGIAGSASVGDHVQMGGQSGAAGHLHIGHHTVAAARAGVTKDLPPGQFVSGFPAVPHAKTRRLHAYTARLPEMKKKLDELEARLKALEPGES